jgi:hypothetical protein
MYISMYDSMNDRYWEGKICIMSIQLAPSVLTVSRFADWNLDVTACLREDLP